MKILIVDDSKQLRDLLAEILLHAGYTDLHMAECGQEALEILKYSLSGNGASDFDLILMDIKMKDLDGIETCRKIKSLDVFRDLPIVMITADSSQEQLAAAFTAGAMDYIVKPFQKTELLARIRSALRYKQEIDLRIARERELEEKNKLLKLANEIFLEESMIDDLTGLYNRRHLEILYGRHWWDCVRKANPFSLLMVDVDHFKAYNDTYGHQDGDAVLKAVAAEIKASLREQNQSIARYGGEEFIVLLPGTSRETAMEIGEEMRVRVEALRIPHTESKCCEYITISLGLAVMLPTMKMKSELLIRRADEALFEAKRNGRNQLCVAPSSA